MGVGRPERKRNLRACSVPWLQQHRTQRRCTDQKHDTCYCAWRAALRAALPHMRFRHTLSKERQARLCAHSLFDVERTAFNSVLPTVRRLVYPYSDCTSVASTRQYSTVGLRAQGPKAETYAGRVGALLYNSMDRQTNGQAQSRCLTLTTMEYGYGHIKA